MTAFGVNGFLPRTPLKRNKNREFSLRKFHLPRFFLSIYLSYIDRHVLSWSVLICFRILLGRVFARHLELKFNFTFWPLWTLGLRIPNSPNQPSLLTHYLYCQNWVSINKNESSLKISIKLKTIAVKIIIKWFFKTSFLR